MHWVLEFKYPEEHQKCWRYVEGDIKHIRNWREAFKYFFNTCGNKRLTQYNYRLAPRFSTKPIPIEYAPRPKDVEVRSGPWVIRQ